MILTPSFQRRQRWMIPTEPFGKQANRITLFENLFQFLQYFAVINVAFWSILPSLQRDCTRGFNEPAGKRWLSELGCLGGQADEVPSLNISLT